MIGIICNSRSSRLEYTCKIIFDLILGVDYQLFEKNIFPNEDLRNNNICWINYSNDTTLPGLFIRNEGWLFEEDIQENKQIYKIIEASSLNLNINQKERLEFDLFSIVFFLITEYGNYLRVPLDTFGRYDESKNELYIRKLHKKPWVNVYAEYLWDIIQVMYPELPGRKKTLGFQITVDVDIPYAYLHKGYRTYLAFLKDLCRWDISRFSDRYKALMKQKDPYDTFQFLFEKLSPFKHKYFFLMASGSKYDRNYSYRHRKFQELIQGIHQQRAETGIHPSFLSSQNQGLLVKEKMLLEKYAGKPVLSARQHYLKYRLPDTYQNLIRAGINHDYTCVLYHDTGFKNFIANSYPWFDLSQNKETSLIIHPGMVMDVALKNYLKLKPDQALDEIQKMISITKKYNGTFILVWHNSSLCEAEQWEGWTSVFLQTLELLKNTENES